jgi:hypothetical protein
VTLLVVERRTPNYQNPRHNQRGEGLTPTSEGDAFLEFPRKDHSIGSLGLNLACEGQLLGKRAEGHGDSKMEAHPRP